MSGENLNDLKEVEEDLKFNMDDSILLLFKALSSFIPNGPLPILLELILPSIVDRQNKWIISLNETVKEHGKKIDKLQPKNLVKNPNFITILIQATQIATRNHQEEKLEALRNAVLNSALETSIEEDMQLMFLNLIDSFTVYHMKILLLIHNPNKYLKNINKKPLDNHSTLIELIEYAFPELDGQEVFFKAIWNDLYNRNLFETSSTNMFSIYTNWRDPKTSELGNKFVLFMKSPLENIEIKY
jgi:hypothetical protein